ncbi:phage tail protein [Enterobacter roggenkampii]|uniref:phage tail protein n=3 Tax=Enterobacter roggenkampii TaxID=1812935 RepID=UPI0021CC5ADC|nr:phage tail protein [Enterobacter roggenkampii]
MATKYLALLTNIGAAKLAKATALGTKVEITQLAVGDGNGVLPTPNPAQTALVHELRRAPLNMLTVDPANASQIIAEQVIPEDVGGWWIREIGLFDKDGDMVAIANCAETYKPQLQEGSGRVQVIRVILIVSSTEAVTLKIDPAVVLATRQYVDSQLRAHEQSRNHPDASTTEKGFVQLSSSVTSDSESQAATSKAVKIAMDNGSARLAKDRNLSDLPNTALARQNLELGDSSTRNVGTTAGTVASGDDARITGAMQKSQNGGDIPDVEKFLQNLGFSEYIKGLIGKGDEWSTWQYLGLVDALNGKQQSDETLTALAGLVNGANKLPYFSGVDQMATADLTAFARGLLGKADAATAKGHLGVGSAGGRNVGTGFSAGGSEIPDMTFFAGLKGSAGYQYFPTGMLLQWGTVVLKSAPSGVSIGTFPVAFPAAGQQIFVTHDNPLANVMAFGAASIIDPTQFRVNAIAINADTFTMAPGYNITLRWFAIGS